MATPEESVEVRLARQEERGATQFRMLAEIKRDLEELKARRMPWVGASALCSGIAAVTTVIALVKR